MQPVASDAELARVAATVPANVRKVCEVLTAAGHQAVTVGGAVRDALLGRTPGDWDVATSATPEQVLALFPRTVPTGLQHGTVTVVTGRPSDVDSHVEVTTFRGEGAYTDARRPDHVVFGVPLDEDLARRDLVVNAIAFDPVTGVLHDPFGGRADIAARRLRAVGDAVARFTEDGLRVMRAVRFAAVLGFELEAATEAGIAPALPSLAKVSRERVSDELRKLLAAPEPSRGLRIAQRTGIVRTVLPALDTALAAAGGATLDERSEAMGGGGHAGSAGGGGGDATRGIDVWLARIDRAPAEPGAVRLAALLAPLASPAHDVRTRDRDALTRAEAILRALKFSNVDSALAAQLVGVARAVDEPLWTPVQARRLLAQLGRDRVPAALALWRAEAAPNAALIAEVERAVADRVPLATGDLALAGNDVIAELGLRPGPQLGRLLAALLDRAIVEPGINERTRLLAVARELLLELPM